MLELQPLTDISEEEIRRLINSNDKDVMKQLSKKIREHLRKKNPTMMIYNSGGNSALVHEANICMSKIGINKTVYKYSNRSKEVSPETKRSLFYLDDLLKNAEYSHPEAPTEGHDNIDHDFYYTEADEIEIRGD